MPSLRIVSKVVGKKPKAKTDTKQNTDSKSTKAETTETLPHSIKLGNKVKFPLSNKTSTGTVRFIGPTKFSSGLWCGIELAKPEGRNNGTVKGVKYFECKFNYGIFIQADKVVNIDGKSENDKKQGKGFSKIPGLDKTKSKSLDHVGPELKVKQLNTSIGDDWVVFEEDNEDQKGELKHDDNDDLKDERNDVDDDGDKRVNEIDTIDEVSEISETEEQTNMKTIITKEIDIKDTPLTIKIAESINNDDNNNIPDEKTDYPDRGLIFYITGHQRPGLTARHKSCPALTIIENEDTVVNGISSHSSKSSESEDLTDANAASEVPKKEPSLKRRLSGIEKRIRHAQLRSPGALRKSFSHGTVYPKENYVAYDDKTDKVKVARPLKRSLSDVTLYHRAPSPIEKIPRVSTDLFKPWLRREKTAPELGDAKKEDSANDDDDVFVKDVSANKDDAKSKEEVSNADLLKAADVDADADANAGAASTMMLQDSESKINDDADAEICVAEVIPTCDAEVAIAEVISNADVDTAALGLVDANPDPEKANNIDDENFKRKQLKSKEPEVSNAVKRLTKSSIPSRNARKFSVPVKITQKVSNKLSTNQLKHSLSQDELSNDSTFSTKDRKLTNVRDKVRPPSKLNKRVSDIVATFEKTKADDDDDKIEKDAQSKPAATKSKIGKANLKMQGRKQETTDKDAKKGISIHIKRRSSSHVSKEELAAKETLSQQYVDKETTRKTSSPAKTSLTDRVSSSKTNAAPNATPRTSTSGTANKAQKTQPSNNVKTKTVETPRKTSIPVKSAASKLNKSGGSPSPNQLKSQDDEKKKIRELKAKCENCENQINSLKDDLRKKNCAMEAFIVVIKQHIQMIEESSRKQKNIEEKNDQLQTELERKSSLLASNDEILKGIEERLEQSSRDYKKQIDSLKKVHNLEKDEIKNALKEQHSKETEQVRNSFDKEITDLRERHAKEIADLEDEHEKLIKNYQNEYQEKLKEKETHYEKILKDTELRCQTEKEEVCLEYEDRLQDLQFQLESAQEKCYEIEAKNVKLQEELDKSIESRLQVSKGEMAKYKNLPAELESLQTVIELKNDELRKSRTQNMELKKKVEDFYELEKKFQKVFQEKEALSVALQNKVKCERQLSVERENLAADLEVESRKVKRLSMEKEELMWKFSNSSSLSLSSPSLNIDTPTSPNGFQSTPNASRSFGRSLKTQSLYLPTLDDEEYTVL